MGLWYEPWEKGARIWHSGWILTPVPGLDDPTQATWSYASYSPGTTLNSLLLLIGITQDKGNAAPT